MRSRKQKQNGFAGRDNGGSGAIGAPASQGGTTGRFLVLFREDAADEGMRVLRERAKVKVAGATTKEGMAAVAGEGGAPDAVFFENLNVASVRGDPSQIQSVAAAADEQGAIVAVEPERIV